MKVSTLLGAALLAASVCLPACSSEPPVVFVSGETPVGSGMGVDSGQPVSPGAPIVFMGAVDGAAPGHDAASAPITFGPSASGDANTSGNPVLAGDAGTSGATGTSGGTNAASGVPCDVATYLATKCNNCHGSPPIPGALASLVTYADLKATAKEDATKNETELSVARMKNAASPMPPGALPSAADVAILENWINAGYPMGACSGDAGPVSPPVAPPSVFKGAPPFAAQTGRNSHNAGRDCMSCHKNGGGEAPRFSLGGTLYDSAGKPVAGAEVRVVGANGQASSVYTGSNGTFYQSAAFVAPAQIGVRNATNVKDMFTPLTAANNGGACSSCHCTGTACTVPLVHLP